MAGLGLIELLRPLGGRGAWDAFEGRHKLGGPRLFVKVLRDDDPKVRLAFRREVRAMARLDHPHILRAIDAGLLGPEDHEVGPPDRPWLCTEWVETQMDASNLTWADINAVLHQVLAALAHAHARGVLHRNLKIANLLFETRKAGLPFVRVSDFGLAASSLAGPTDLSNSLAVSNPATMAPEQILGAARAQGPWTDLYAVGSLAYELASGKPPFEGRARMDVLQRQLLEPFPSVVPRIEVPPAFDLWIERLTRKDPADRIQSAASARAELFALARSERLEEGAMAFDSDEDTIDTVILGTWIPRKAVVVRGRSGARPPPLRVVDDVGGGPSSAGSLAGLGLGLLRDKMPPFVGRKLERTRLWERFTSSVADAVPTAVVIRGGLGVGRSRLAAWLAEEASIRAGAESWTAVWSPDAPDDVAPLAAAMSVWARAGSLKGADLERRVVERMRHLGPHEESSVRRAAHWMAVPTWSEGDVARSVVAAIASARSMVLVLVCPGAEALAWVEPLLSFVPRLMVVLVEPRRPVRFDVDTIDVSAMDDDAVGRVLDGLVGLSAELRQRIVNRAAGNPGFALALLYDAQQRGVLQSGARGVVTSDGTTFDALGDWADVWRADLDGLRAILEPADERALQLALVHGGPFEDHELDVACERLGHARAAELRDALLAVGLARSTPDGGWAFASPGFVEVARSVLLADGGRDFHDAWFRASGDDTPVHVRARFAFGAARWDEAATLLLAAGREAVRSQSLRVSVQFIDQCETALDHARAAKDDARRLHATLDRSTIELMGLDPPRGLARARALLGQATGRDREALLYTLGHGEARYGSLPRAWRSFRALEPALASEDRAIARLRVLASEAQLLASRGRFADALPHAEAAMSCVRSNDPSGTSYALCVRGLVLAAIDVERAEQDLEQAAGAAFFAVDPRFATLALAARASILYAKGDLVRSRVLLEEVELARHRIDGVSAVGVDGHRLHLRWRLDGADAIGAELVRYRSDADAGGMKVAMAIGDLLRAVCQIGQGREDEMAEATESALTLVRDGRLWDFVLFDMAQCIGEFGTGRAQELGAQMAQLHVARFEARNPGLRLRF